MNISFSDEILLHIFDFLDFSTLDKASRVSTQWRRVAKDPVALKKKVLERLAFTGKDWARLFSLNSTTFEEEANSLDVSRVLSDFGQFKLHIFPHKSFEEALMLVRLPKGLSLNKLAEIAKTHFFPENENGFREYWWYIKERGEGDREIDEDQWVLMTKETLPGCQEPPRSSGTFDSLSTKACTLLQNVGIAGYTIPTGLEAVACIFAQYIKDGHTRLFSDKPWSATWCQETDGSFRLLVGHFTDKGLYVDADVGKAAKGIAVMRKFNG